MEGHGWIKLGRNDLVLVMLLSTQSVQHPFNTSQRQTTWLNAKELGPYLISMSLQSMLYPLAIAYAWFSWTEPTPWLDSKGVVI